MPNKKDRLEFLQCSVDEHLLDEIKKASKLVVTSIGSKSKNISDLKKMFEAVSDTKERNKKVFEAYEEGYSQYQIAEVLDFSQAYINQIVKRVRKSKMKI